MTKRKSEQSKSELENVNEVLSVVEESKKTSKKETSEKKNEEQVLENLNEVITFDTPVSEVITLNE